MGYGTRQKRRKEATAQLEAEKMAGGRALHKGRTVSQIGSGKAYDPSATKNQNFIKFWQAGHDTNFRNRPEISGMRDRAAAFKKNQRETPEQTAARLRKRRR